MASIVDVARRAGVSQATASRVLSGASYPVSEDARDRVLVAAQELDFVPNALARGLVKSHVPILGVIVHDITDPYFAEIVRGVEDAASPSGNLVITCSSDRRPEREVEYVRLLRSIRTWAVIFAGSGIDDAKLTREVRKHNAAIRALGGAVVRLSPHADGPPDVGFDNVAGIAVMVQALVGLGHTRIAYLSGPERLFVSRDRLAGYRAGLEAAGLAYDASIVVGVELTVAGGAQGVRQLIAQPARYTAVLCANDLVAMGAQRQLQQLGIAVPEQISVAGFDGIPTADYMAPSLSTVRLPLHELGRRAFLFAEQVVRGKRPRRTILSGEVVLRGSTSRPADDSEAGTPSTNEAGVVTLPARSG